MRSQPVYFNLFKVKFPVTAIASILHRLSGVLLFVFIPFFLMLLNNAMHYAAGLEQLANYILSSDLNRAILWIALSALIYHLLAGVRHLMMDCGYGENKDIATTSAYIIIASSVLFSLALGLRLC